MPDTTPLGELIEQAREEKGLSKREAARRAGISEGRWRQVVSGQQKSGNVTIRVNPRPATIVAMARAVGVDEKKAMDAAGYTSWIPQFAPAVEHVDAIDVPADDPVEALIEEIYANAHMPEERKQELVRLIRRAEAQREAELRAAQDELRRWRRGA